MRAPTFSYNFEPRCSTSVTISTSSESTIIQPNSVASLQILRYVSIRSLCANRIIGSGTIELDILMRSSNIMAGAKRKNATSLRIECKIFEHITDDALNALTLVGFM